MPYWYPNASLEVLQHAAAALAKLQYGSLIVMSWHDRLIQWRMLEEETNALPVVRPATGFGEL